MINMKSTSLLLLLLISSVCVKAQSTSDFLAYVNKLYQGFPVDSNQQYKEAYMLKDTGYVKKRKTIIPGKLVKYKPATAYIYSMSENVTLLSLEYADIDKRTSFKEFTDLTNKLKKVAPASEFKKVEPEPGQTGPPDLQYSFFKQEKDSEPVMEIFLMESYKMIYIYYYKKRMR